MKPILCLFSLAIISISCFSGCNKGDSDGPTTADGHIIDATTGKGIGGAKAIIVRRKKASMTALDATQIASQVTDANGHFHFEFDGEESYGYTVVGSAIYHAEDSEGGHIIPGKNNKDIKVKITPLGYLQIKLKNEPPSDTVAVYIYGSFNPTIVLAKYSGDTTFFRQVLGNTNSSVVLETRSSSGEAINKYSIFSPALDTVDITLKY
jgi:hypothetical protein